MASIDRAIQENDQHTMMLQRENLKRFHKYLILKDAQVMKALTNADEERLEAEIFEAFADLESNMYHPDDRVNTKLPIYRTPSNKSEMVHAPMHCSRSAIPIPSRSVSQMTLADKLAMAKREELRKGKLAAKRDRLRIERESKLIVPLQLTPAEKERVQIKKKKYDQDYEDHLKTARAVGAVKKLMREVNKGTPTNSQTLLKSALQNGNFNFSFLQILN